MRSRPPLLTRAVCHVQARRPLASSTGLLLKTTGLKVTAIKIDPYMNIDAGTMAPTEHGELIVFNEFRITDASIN